MLEMLMSSGGKAPDLKGNVKKYIADSNSRAFALDESGNLYARGADSTEGRLGNGGVSSVGKWVNIISAVKDFWVSPQFVVIQMVDNNRWFWFGRYLDAGSTAVLVPTEMTAQMTSLTVPVKKLVIGTFGMAILDTDNNLYTKGYNYLGWMFTGNMTSQPTLTKRTETNIKDISFCAVTSALFIHYNDGVVKGAGDSSSGALGLPVQASQTTLRQITSGAENILAGASCLWVKVASRWYYLGEQRNGQTGGGVSTGNVTSLTLQPSLDGATDIISDSYRTWALLPDGWYFTGSVSKASGTAINTTAPWTATDLTRFAKIPFGIYPIIGRPNTGTSGGSSQSTYVDNGNVYGCGDATANKLLPGFGTQNTILGFRKLNMDFSFVE